MTPTHLYYYQCPNCKTQAAHTVKVKVSESPILCPLDRRFMVFQYEVPITTERHQDIARQGFVLNPHMQRKPAKCDTCRAEMVSGTAVKLVGVGKFCSDECATVGSEKHARYMQRIEDEQQDLRKKWLPKERTA